MRWLGAIAAVCVAAPFAALAAPGDVSVERGLQVSITGGCHDCHTGGYNESGGKIDPATSLKGTAIGWRGPWGTTYPMNLRITAEDKSEADFVAYIKALKTRPPMPWYNLHAMDESDVAVDALNFRYDSGLYLMLEATCEGGLQDACAAARIADKDFAAAKEILDQRVRVAPLWAGWVQAVLHWRAGRWHDVRSTLAPLMAQVAGEPFAAQAMHVTYGCAGAYLAWMREHGEVG